MKARWVSKHATIAIHFEQIAEHGGAKGISDEKLLESALARPRNLAAYKKPSIFELASAYAFGIVKNHPFVDGNKRVGLVVAGTFLYLNSWALNASEADAANIFLRLADGKVSQKKIAEWFKENSTPLK